MPWCSDDTSIAQPTAEPTTRPSISATKVVNFGSSKSSSHSATASSIEGQRDHREDRRGDLVLGERDLEPAEGDDVAALRPADDHPVRDPGGLIGCRRLADPVDVLQAEPGAEPGVDEGRVRRGHDDGVPDRAGLHPAARERAVQVADELRVGDGVAGALDPHVRAPGPAARGRDEVAGDRPVAQGDRAVGTVPGGEPLDLGAGGSGVLEPRIERRLDEPLGAMPVGQEPRSVVRELGGERPDLEARPPLGHADRAPRTSPRRA